MEFCKYCKIGAYTSFCTCKITGELCPFVRKFPCIQQWKPLDSMERCLIRKENERTNMENNKVRFEKKGKLFVEVDDFVIEINNPYDYCPDCVDVININDKYYIKGFEPKKIEMKKKINKEEKEDEEKKENKEDKKSISTIDE